jgi:myo-inositol-1(or 4)-monophosphatase
MKIASGTLARATRRATKRATNLATKSQEFHGREAIDYEVFAKVNCVNSKLVYKACYTLAMATMMETALQIAKQTGELLRGYFRSANLHSSLKADQSVVTDADYAADEFIQSALQREFPHDLIMSEERKTRLTQKELSDHRSIWMIDPLDGTTNFSLGLHIWGVLLTQLVNGFPERAALHFPILQETYWAEKGRGAFMNNEPIHVQPPRKDYPLPFFACCSRTFQMHEINVPYKPRILGSAAYSMCCVARGVAVLGFDATPKIWDIAGAWLLVREAGGVIETIDCPNPFPLQANIDYTQTNLKTLAAATKKSLLKANQQIIPKT